MSESLDCHKRDNDIFLVRLICKFIISFCLFDKQLILISDVIICKSMNHRIQLKIPELLTKNFIHLWSPNRNWENLKKRFWFELRAVGMNAYAVELMENGVEIYF